LPNNIALVSLLVSGEVPFARAGLAGVVFGEPVAQDRSLTRAFSGYINDPRRHTVMLQKRKRLHSVKPFSFLAEVRRYPIAYLCKLHRLRF
jgi:hypothetical protein